MTPLEAAGDSTIPAQLKHETVLTNPDDPGSRSAPARWHRPCASANGARRAPSEPHRDPDRPAAVPAALFVSGIPTYFTVQPGGAYLNKGAQIIYPNWGHLPPGQRVDFWNYDPSDRGWYIYGKGTRQRGRQAGDPRPRRAGVGIHRRDDLWRQEGPRLRTGSRRSPTGGDPVDLGTGLFVYQHNDLQLPDSVMPFALTRTYRPGDNNSHSFGIGTGEPIRHAPLVGRKLQSGVPRATRRR